MVALNPDFKPPADYKPPATRVSDKVMIPQDEYPEINFVGLLIGPRGNTLKNIEKECNAKIMIRGKGSVKEGKVGRKDGQMLPGEDEPLHALVTANTMENVKKAVEQIRNILKQGIETPEDQNDLRKMQLRELARLNGTLREDDNRILRPWQSSETRSITNTTVCTKCGGAGHIASDCKFQRPGDPQSAQDKARMDKEYLSLMAELGEAPVPASVGSTSGPASTPLASAPRPAAPANNPPPPSLMSTTQSRPPWMNSGPSESRPYHGMHGGGPGGPGGGPHSFPHPLPSLTGGHGGHPMQHNPNGPPPPWMQPPPPPMNQGPHPPGHHGPPPMGKSVPGKYACGLWGLSPASRKRYDAAAAYGHDAATAAAAQWAAPAPALWSSSSMAAAAAAASATPSAQQQYGFQYPLAMAAKIPSRGGDGPSHESEDFPRPLVTLPGRQPQQRPWWTGWFGKAA
ncbi:PREDICTED: splicing factor 1 isoform X8 [Hipposideros armiger]|nr:PREDICTED: splicing factor 1 isoform X8 [Hipposideros armiger]